MFELLFIGFVFLIASALYGCFHGFVYWREERNRKRFVVRWKERMRVKSLMRLINGGKDDGDGKKKDE